MKREVRMNIKRKAEGRRNPSRSLHILLCFPLAAASLAGTGAVTAFAASPEFAYSAEKWASLRDDKLEYDEIADLIHEYNNTVIQNQIEYEDYRNEDKDDIAQDYYDAANEIYWNLEYPDSDSTSYASSLSSYLSSRIQADRLKELGDDNVDDGEIKKLGYDQTEANLVKQAQQLMITYWSQMYAIENQQISKEQAELTYSQTQTKLQAGMATQTDLLNAGEAVTSAEASLLSAQSSVSQTKESLCLMLGWTYGAQVEICEVPEPDLEAIAAIDLEADMQKGLEENYALRILARQVTNAQYGSNKDSLEQNLKSQKETAANSIKSAYEQLLLAQSNYEQALQSFELEQSAMATADRKMQAGVITKNDYRRQSTSFSAAQLQVRTQKLALLKAQLDYDWSVGGLASVT